MSVITDEMVEIAKRASRRAGQTLLEHRGQVAGKLKGFRDFVSEADLQSESLLLDEFHRSFPDHSVLSEEGGGTTLESADYCWIIDPLDGTKNYLWGVPLANVSVALAFRGRVGLGVVFDPWRDEMFWAREGMGAFLNDRAVHVNEHLTLAGCLVATDFSVSEKRIELTADMSRSIQGEVAGLRAFGSAALALSYVACGRLDAYFNHGLHAWDMAAGGFIVREAGGRTTDLRGESDYLFGRGCLSTNGHVHDEVLHAWERNGVIPFDLA